MSNYIIKYFMWGFQHYARSSLQYSAENLFKKIDLRLKPNVFLIGILQEERENKHHICIEPEDCGYSVSAFAEVEKLALELEKVDKEKNKCFDHEASQIQHDIRLRNYGLIKAIKKILIQKDSFGELERFVSYPINVEGYLVFVVLEIQKEIFNSYYSLIRNIYNDVVPISRSFIESVIDIYLKEASNSLKDSQKSSFFIDRPIDELLREAATKFMITIAQVGNNFDGFYGLYDVCNAISSLKYEGAEGMGKMIIAKKNHFNVRTTLQLKEPISIRDFRKVRKFLELSDKDSILICDSELIYGLGELSGKYNPKEESLFVINFISHFKWEVLHDDNPMMIVEFNQPNLHKENIDGIKFNSNFKRLFKGIDEKQIRALWDLANQATKQTHGTMLVITDNAIKEAKRLGKQSFSIKPLKLNTDIIQQITSIDGAVLLDRDGICHAIGVILDGLATDKGDASRGARFNSAVRYYEKFGKKQPTIIVIISEDGMINLIPNLNPQIEHKEIIKNIEEFKKFSETKEINRKHFNKFMNFFEKLEFYLTELECEQINQLRKVVEEKENTTEGIRILRNDLRPNPEMNESYYLENNEDLEK